MYCTRRPYFSSLTRPQDWIKYFPYILELMDNGNIKPFRIICRQVDILFFRSDILAIIPYGKTLRGLCKGGGYNVTATGSWRTLVVCVRIRYCPDFIKSTFLTFHLYTRQWATRRNCYQLGSRDCCNAFEYC